MRALCVHHFELDSNEAVRHTMRDNVRQTYGPPFGNDTDWKSVLPLTDRSSNMKTTLRCRYENLPQYERVSSNKKAKQVSFAMGKRSNQIVRQDSIPLGRLRNYPKFCSRFQTSKRSFSRGECHEPGLETSETQA